MGIVPPEETTASGILMVGKKRLLGGKLDDDG